MLEAGTVFGRYRIRSLVGRGGMGVVYLAEDITLGRRIALKVLDRGFTEDIQFEKRFRQEARTVANLQHPNIVPIHALENVEGTLAIDMPFMEGGSLCGVPGTEREKRQQTVASVRGILAALACCHRSGIVHRDVKPSNILIRGDGTPLLSDFGLARILAEQQSASFAVTSSSGYFVGTPRYAPPESWDGKEAAPSWDVYSVGMVLYEAFAPKFPYDAQTPMGLVKQILERSVPPLAEVAQGVSGEFSRAVALMLDRDPEERPRDASVAEEMLKAAPEWKASSPDAGSTVIRWPSPRPLPLPEPEPQPVPRAAGYRPRWRTILGVAAAVMVALGAVVAVVQLALTGRTEPGFDGAAAPVEAPAGRTSVSDYAVFDTVEPASGAVWPRHLLMLSPGDVTKWKALAYEGTHIWALEISTQNPETLHVEGHWAGYNDRTASVFQHGDVAGTGRWIVPNEEVSIALEFKNLLDGSRNNRAFICRRAKGGESDVDFLAGFASSDFARPLLYNEVMPRRLQWSKEVETDFLRRLFPRVVALRLSEGTSPITLDGTLDEAIWKSSILVPASERGPIAAGNRLLCLYDARGLYVGVRMAASPGDPELVLSVTSQFEIPASQSARWAVIFGHEGIRGSRSEASGRPVPWQSEWETGLVEAGGFLECEVFIPFSNLGAGLVPKAGDRWHVAGSLADAANPANPGHGLIVVFGTESGE